MACGNGVASLLLTTVSDNCGVGVDAAIGFTERPVRTELVDGIDNDVVGILSSFTISFDGVEARESLSRPFELVIVPSGFFGFVVVTAARNNHKQHVHCNN